MALINDILDFSKIEAGRLSVEQVEFETLELVNEIKDLMAPEAISKKLEFKVQFAEDAASQICTDPMRLRQCLLNLVSNAIKFTEKGYVEIRVRADSNEQEGKWIRFDVEDTGIGIAKSKQELIFDPFSQAEKSTTRKFGGTGLGLTITKKLVELLDGKIELMSRVGKGSRFSLIIPIQSDMSREYRKSNEIKRVKKGVDRFSGVKWSGKVLVAEDNPPTSF